MCQARELTFLTQWGMVCVLGERWWVLMTMTVMMMEAMTNTIVNSMYLPIRGTALDVEGISSTMTRRNTVKDSRTEMLRVIFSPVVKKPPKIIAAPIIQYREYLFEKQDVGESSSHKHLCAFAVLSCLPTSKTASRLGKPESLSSAPALRWKLPELLG